MLREQLHELTLRKLPLDLLDLSEPAELPRAQAQQLLLQRMKGLVAHRQCPTLVVVVGGFNLLSICQVTGAQSLIAGARPQPGWESARLVGGVWDGLCCYLHSGNFTPTDDLFGLFAHLPFTSKQALAAAP